MRPKASAADQPSSGGREWLAFAAWTVVIFTLVPFANDIQGWIRRQLGGQALFYGLVVLLLVAVVSAGRWIWTHRRQRLGASLLWIVAICGAIGGWSWFFRDAAEPAHFVAFSILGVLAFRALSTRFRDSGVYLAAAALVAIVGTVDEILQWLTPGRFWDLGDIAINAGTAALVQVLIWRGIRPRGISSGISPGSLKLGVRLLVVEAVLLLFCVSNTPGRIAWYAERIPGLDYLGRERSTRMPDYGHLVDDPEIGRFYSRLSAEELSRIDGETGVEAARILQKFRKPAQHSELKQAHPPWRDPFVYEMREHLTARNRHRGRMLANLAEPEVAGAHATAAFREQLILEKYWGNTFREFGDGLRPADRRQLEELSEAARRSADPSAEEPLASNVATWLVTGFSEAQARWILLAVLLVLLSIERWASRRMD